PRFTHFPYTTLFRSRDMARCAATAPQGGDCAVRTASGRGAARLLRDVRGARASRCAGLYPPVAARPDARGRLALVVDARGIQRADRKSTRLNSSHVK